MGTGGICPPSSPSETFSLSRDFQHLASEASVKYHEVALLIISVMIVNKRPYFVDPFSFCFTNKRSESSAQFYERGEMEAWKRQVAL